MWTPPRRHHCAKVVRCQSLTGGVRDGSYNNRRGFGQECVPGARGERLGNSCVPQEASARQDAVLLRGPISLCGGDGSVRECPLLGARTRTARPSGAADRPAYVKPFVKRQKNDAADAEAICEAAQRPTMRFVAVKSEAKQALSAVFRVRDLLVGQRTQLINALRGHLGEYGVVAPQGPFHVERLIVEIGSPKSPSPKSARTCLQFLVDTLRALRGRIDRLDMEITARAKHDEGARRLMEIPGDRPHGIGGLRASLPPSHECCGTPLRLAQRTTPLAPMIRSRRKVRSPMREVRPSRVLPPLDFCTGVRRTHTAKSRHERKGLRRGSERLNCGGDSIAFPTPAPPLTVRPGHPLLCTSRATRTARSTS